MSTPYHTGRVSIGSRFQRESRPVYTSADQDRVQAALLDYQRHQTVKAGGHMQSIAERREEAKVAANRSQFEDSMIEAEKMRLASLRKRPIPVGGGLWRKFKLMVRDSLLYIMGDKA